MSKQKISRRNFLRVVSAVGAGSFLAACAPQAAPQTGEVKSAEEKQPETQQPVAKVPKAEPVKITIWGWWADRMKFFDEAGKKFTAKNPEVTVEVISVDQDLWTKVFASVPASTGPTLCKMQTTNYFKMVDQKMLLPLDEMAFPKEELKKLFPNHAWDAYGTYVVPEGNQCGLFIYNKEMFTKAGLDPENPPKTWNDMWEAARKLTQYESNGAISVEGFIPDDWLPNLEFLYQQGQMVVKNDSGKLTANFDTPEMGITYDMLRDAAFTWKVWDKAFPYFTETLGTEKAAMSICEAWVRGEVNSSYPEVGTKMGYGVPPTPTGEAKPYYGRQNSVLGLASLINRPQNEIDAGRKYLEFLYKEDKNSQFKISDIAGLVPAHVDNLSRPEMTSDPYYSLQKELVGKEYDTVDIGGGFSDIFYKALDMLVVNQDSTKTILAFGQTELQKLIDNGDIKYTQ